MCVHCWQGGRIHANVVDLHDVINNEDNMERITISCKEDEKAERSRSRV